MHSIPGVRTANRSYLLPSSGAKSCVPSGRFNPPASGSPTMKKLLSIIGFFALLIAPQFVFAQQVVLPCYQVSGAPCQAVNSTHGLPVTITGPISSVVNLGTSTSATSPRITGDATSGFYTAGAGLVDVSINGNKIAEFNAINALDLSSTTSSLVLPVGTSGTRPGSGINGMIRYNSATPAIEGYINSSWSSLATTGNLNSIALGTAAAATNPQRSGQAGTGFYTAGSGLVDISSGGAQQAEVSSTGLEVFNPLSWDTTTHAGVSAYNMLAAPEATTATLVSNGTTVTAQPGYKSIATCNFYDYLLANNITYSSLTTTTRTQQFINWLLDCQVKYFKAVGNQSFDNLTFPTGITALLPNMSGDFGINNLAVSPRYVHLKPYAQPVRVGNGTTSTTTDWPASATDQSLAVLYYPAIWLQPGSGIDVASPLKMNLNSDGVNYGPGGAYGGYMQVKSATLQATGNSMTNGDTCTVSSGDTKQPYRTISGTIAVTGGHVTSFTYTGTEFNGTAGAFGLIPYMQKLQWTAANGWNNGVGASFQPTVFDGSGNYLLNCPHGDQTASVSLTWYKPFEHNYWEPKFTSGVGAGGVAYTDEVGDIYLSAGDPNSATSGTYGNKIGWQYACHDCTLGRFENSQGNDLGFEITGTDVRSTGGLNSVGAGICGALRGGGGAVLQITCDSNRTGGLSIGNYSNYTIFYNSFHNSSNAAGFTDSLLRIGDSNYGCGAGVLAGGGTIYFGNGYSSNAAGGTIPGVVFDYANSDNTVYGTFTNVQANGSTPYAQLISPAVSWTANAVGGSFIGTDALAADSSETSGTIPTKSFLDLYNPTTNHHIREGNAIWAVTSSSALDLSNNTTAMTLPVGTTGQRPTGVNGMIRYNSTNKVNEGYEGGNWWPFSSYSRSPMISGRHYTALVAPLGTVGTFSTATPSAGFTCHVIELDSPHGFADVAFEITTAIAATWHAHICIYPNPPAGIPDNQAPIIDSGNMTFSSSATGAQIQAAGSWSVGTSSTIPTTPSVWACLEDEFNATTSRAYRAINVGSAGGGTAAGNAGETLVQGSSTSGQNYAGRSVAAFTYGACPSSFTTSVMSANTSVPIIWLGD
jgi:hypothetical protein